MTDQSVVCPNCSNKVEVGLGQIMLNCTACGQGFMAPPSNSENQVFDPPSQDALPPVEHLDSSDVIEEVFPQMTVQKSDAEKFISDVVEFGNSPGVANSNYGLAVNIELSGIDSPEIKKQIIEYLTDKRLEMNAANLFSNIKGGKLQLKEVSPIKASVIINRLKHLPLEITWKAVQTLKLVIILSFFVLSQAEARPWGQHEVNLAGYAVQIKNGHDQLRHLLAEKERESDPQKRDHLTMEVTQKYKELSNLYQTYRKEQEHIRFEHPEQGDDSERQYRRMKLKSLEELEDELGVDGQVSRLKRQVDEKYLGKKYISIPKRPAIPKKEKKKEEAPAPAAHH